MLRQTCRRLAPLALAVTLLLPAAAHAAPHRREARSRPSRAPLTLQGALRGSLEALHSLWAADLDICLNLPLPLPEICLPPPPEDPSTREGAGLDPHGLP